MEIRRSLLGFFYAQKKGGDARREIETSRCEVLGWEGSAVPAKDVRLPSRWKLLGKRDAPYLLLHQRVFPVNFHLAFVEDNRTGKSSG